MKLTCFIEVELEDNTVHQSQYNHGIVLFLVLVINIKASTSSVVQIPGRHFWFCYFFIIFIFIFIIFVSFINNLCFRRPTKMLILPFKMYQKNNPYVYLYNFISKCSFLYKISSFNHKKGLSNSYYKFVYKTISLKYMLSGKGC